MCSKAPHCLWPRCLTPAFKASITLTSHIHSDYEPFKMPSPFLAIHQNSLNHSKITQRTIAKGLSYTLLPIQSDLFLPRASVLPLVPLITNRYPGQLHMSYSLIKLKAPFKCRKHVLSFPYLASTMMPCWLP